MPVSSIPFVRRKDAKDSTTRKQRKDLRDFTNETALGIYGGALGGALGTPLGPPGVAIGSMIGAGAGAGLGRGLSLLEDRVEYGEDPGRTAQDAMREMGEAALWGAGGEGFGRVVQLAPQMAKNIAKLPFLQTPEAKILSDLADRYNIPLNLAERSGRGWLRLAEVGLDRLPFSTGVIRKARREQYKAWTDAINDLLDKTHKGEVSPDEFAAKAETAFAGLRKTFNEKVGGKAAKAAEEIRPTPASKTEAGLALRDARNENLAGVKRWANQAYGEVRKVLGDVPIDVSQLSDGLQEISPAAEALFSPKAKNAISTARRLAGQPNPDYFNALQEAADAVGAASISELREKAPPLFQKEVELLAQRGITPVKGGEPMPMTQVLELRSQVLDSISRLNAQPNAADTRALYGLLDGIQTTLETSVENAAKAAPPPQSAAISGSMKKLRETNARYREAMRTLNPPRGARDTGNIAAGVLNDARINPDDIPGRITASPTMIEGAAKATSPDAMSALQRNKFDELVDGATVDDAVGGTSRVSPTRFRANIKKFLPMNVLFDKKTTDAAADLGGQGLVKEEISLYNRALPRAIDSGEANRVMARAFPARSSRVAEANLQLLDESGVGNVGRRAYADALLDKARKPDPTLGGGDYLTGEKLRKAMGASGGTLDTVLGQDAVRGLTDLSDIGQGMRISEKEFGNPSGTARAVEILSTTGAVLGAPFNPALAASTIGSNAAAYGAAKAFVNPNLAKRLAADPKLVLPMLAGAKNAKAGAAGQVGVRAVNSFFGVPLPKPLPEEDDPDLVPLEDNDPDLIPLN